MGVIELLLQPSQLSALKTAKHTLAKPKDRGTSPLALSRSANSSNSRANSLFRHVVEFGTGQGLFLGLPGSGDAMKQRLTFSRQWLRANFKRDFHKVKRVQTNFQLALLGRSVPSACKSGVYNQVSSPQNTLGVLVSRLAGRLENKENRRRGSG